jgi:hypothetical protein
MKNRTGCKRKGNLYVKSCFTCAVLIVIFALIAPFWVETHNFFVASNISSSADMLLTHSVIHSTGQSPS